VSVSAHHNQIGGGISRVRKDRRWHVDFWRGDPFDIHLEAVAREVLAKVGAGNFIFLARFVGDNDNLDLFCLFQKRHGVANGACGGPAAIPAHHDAVERHSAFLDEGHENHRSPGFEQHALVDDFIG